MDNTNDITKNTTNITLTLSEFIEHINYCKPKNILNLKYTKKFVFNYYDPISEYILTYSTDDIPHIFDCLRCERTIFLQKINFTLRKDKILKLKSK